jgi:uncharacterized protein YlxP (DUF503 family)
LIGIAVVSNNKRVCDESISKIVKFIDYDERVEILSCNKEII